MMPGSSEGRPRPPPRFATAAALPFYTSDSRIADRAQSNTMTFCLDVECLFWQLSTWYEKMPVISSIPMKPAAYLACLIALSFGGCSMLPSAGPVASEVVAAGQAETKVLFDIVEVDNHVVSTLLAQPKESFHARFEKGLQPAGTQDRGRRHPLGHGLGECSGRALQRSITTTTPQPDRDRRPSR